MNEIDELVSKITRRIMETEEEFILETIIPYALTIEKRINKEELKKAIVMYYQQKDSKEVEE